MPLLWIWLPLCGVGMVLLPWLAVLIANDRAPHNTRHMRRYRKQATSPNALPAQQTGPTVEGTTIEGHA